MAKKEATCRCCKNLFAVSDMRKRDSKGKGFYYVCDNCLDFKNCSSVEQKYDFEIVKEGKVAFIVQFNFSTKNSFTSFDILRDEYDWNILLGKEDNIYLKSCLYTSKNAMPKSWGSLDELVEINQWNNENDYLTPCYVYVGKIGERYCEIVQSDYMQLFKAIYDILISRPSITNKIFGAIPVDGLCTEDELRSFFVDVKDNCIVFKFCKYKSVGQYMETIRIVQEICEKINTWYVKEYDNCNVDTMKYEDIIGYRTHRVEMLMSTIERKICAVS